MRLTKVPVLVFICSIALVGFTFLPSHSTAPMNSEHPGEGPLLFAYRLPALAGVDRIAWWAWNPMQRSVWMATPEEGWAEVENNLILWSAQLEPVPAKAWQQLSGVIPVPGTVEIGARAVQSGTFLADLPSSVPVAPMPQSGEATALRTAPKRMPLVLRCGWFEKPFAGRPLTFEAYQQAVASQGTAVSNALTADPMPPVFTSSDPVPGNGDRL